MLPVCYPSSPSPTTGLPEAVAYALSSVSGLTRWVDYIPVKLVGSPLGMNEQTTNLNGFVPMRLLGSAIGMNAWRDYIPVYVDNSATEAWVTSATGYIPYANSVLGATAPVQPLRFASPYNRLNTIAGIASSTTYLNVRGRIPFYIGSGDMSQLVFAFSGFNVTGGNINALGNDYTIVSMAIEKDGGTYAPVTFSGGRSQVVTSGAIEVLSDALLPSAFSLSKFTKGEKYWMRIEYSVAATGLKFMQNYLPYGQISVSGAVGVAMSGSSVVAAVDATGTMTYASIQNFSNFYTPLVLGRFVSGDPKTIIGLGDSIIQGVGDTNANGQSGGFSQALTDADHLSNPIAGATFGYSGSVASLWSGANSSFILNYLKYAKYAVDEYQTNKFQSLNNSLATAKSEVLTLWTSLANAGITTVLRTKIHPRTTDATNTALLPSCFTPGGDARLFNDWLDTPGLGSAQGVTLTLLPINSTRASTNQTLDNFYFWDVAGSTADGTHPSPAGHALEAAEFRTAFAALP